MDSHVPTRPSPQICVREAFAESVQEEAIAESVQEEAMSNLGSFLICSVRHVTQARLFP